MIGFAQFFWMCWRAWRHKGGDFHYFALSRHGVPTDVIVIGRGREAWNVCDFVANYVADRKVPAREIRQVP